MNTKLISNFDFNFQVDLKEFWITIGSGSKNSDCETSALYYDFNLFNSSENFVESDLLSFSNGFATPVFMSKFGYEPSYNKRYNNILFSGIGDLINGENLQSFDQFTSLSAA